MRVLDLRPVGFVCPGLAAVSPWDTQCTHTGRKSPSVPSVFTVPSLTSIAQRDVESNFTGVLCCVYGLVLRELCSGVVSTQTFKTPNATQRPPEHGQPGPELPLPRKSRTQTALVLFLRLKPAALAAALLALSTVLSVTSLGRSPSPVRSDSEQLLCSLVCLHQIK